MTRTSKSPPRRGAHAGSGRGGPRRRWLALALIAAAVVVALAMLVARRREARSPAPAPAPSMQALAALNDSLNSAFHDGDLDAALEMAARLAHAVPGNSSVIRMLGVMLHDHATMVRPRFGAERSATRTSLERIETELRVLALMDSAAALARTPEDWAKAREWYGQTLENLGMPLDAIGVYAEVLQRVPGSTSAAGRAAWLSERLKDPRVRDPEGAR